jgi:hypothetical protein
LLDFLRLAAAPLRLVPIAFYALPTPLVASFLGMTLSSLSQPVYGILEARVDFDRSRSTY